MKRILRVFLVVFALAGGHPRACAATLILDSFSQGDFILQSGGANSNDTTITSPLMDSRIVDGFGVGTWSVSLASGSGSLNYSVTEILEGQGTTRFGMNFRYERTGADDLLGYSAFSLDFTNVSGTALLEVFVKNQNAGAMIPVTLDSSGQLIYSFANLAANDLSAITDISFRVIPQSDTFSFALNEVSVVPEPSTLILCMFGAAGAFWRRRN